MPIMHLRPFAVGVALTLLVGCTGLQRQFLFHPTHHAWENTLAAWTFEGRTIGYSRPVAAPTTVWLMLHGNGGQASDRRYALSAFSEHDSVFILEYPGYGRREGKPSKASFDAAAAEAYSLLRNEFPTIPVGVVGESIGSGPASMLARQTPPPDKIVLVVPFDRLTSVAAEHVSLPVGSLLEARWDNALALSGFRGPVEIFGAENDTVIPVAHAEKLARAVPGAVLHRIPGGHNDWASPGRVSIRLQ